MPEQYILPYGGKHEIHPSELTPASGYRIVDDTPIPIPTGREEYAGTAMLRARFRGPFESWKLNKNKADIYRDLKVLTKRMDYEKDRLESTIYTMMNTVSNPISIRAIQEDGVENFYDGYYKLSAQDLQLMLDTSNNHIAEAVI